MGREILSAAKSEGGYIDSDDEEEADEEQNGKLSRISMSKLKLSQLTENGNVNRSRADKELPGSGVKNDTRLQRITKMSVFTSVARLD